MAQPINSVSQDTRPGTGAVALSVGGANVTPGRSVLVDCTAGGSATFKFADDSTATLHFQAAGIYEFNYALQGVTATAGGFTGTFYNIY